MLTYTPIEQIQGKYDIIHKGFHETHVLESIDFRISILQQIYKCVKENQESLAEAINKDFNRPKEETIMTEINPCLVEIQYIISNLRRWTSDDKKGFFDKVPLLPYLLTDVRTEHIPLGKVLVIAPFNFPLTLLISPVVGAIAAGNGVILKPSELIENTSELLTKLLYRHVDPRVLQIVNGAIPETSELLKLHFDKIFYTGSTAVGKIISIAAAKQLTPVVLELGGKSPCILCKSLSDNEIRIAIKRILWAKFSNGGQVCITVDYLLVDDAIYEKVIEYLKDALKELLKDCNSKNFTHIVNERNFKRLNSMIENSDAESIFGEKDLEGVLLPKDSPEVNFLRPRIFKNVEWEDSLMLQEIFGPILPILKYDDLNKDAIRNIIKYHDTPLACYVFSKNEQVISLARRRIRSGSFFVNDSLLQFSMMSVPFGGIGTSGSGKYHGKASFDTFSHERTVMKQYFITEKLLEMRYPKTLNTQMATFLFMPFGDACLCTFSKIALLACILGMATIFYWCYHFFLR